MIIFLRLKQNNDNSCFNGRRALERIFHQLTKFTLYFVKNLPQEKPGPMAMELGKAIRVGSEGEMRKNRIGLWLEF